MTLNTNYLKVVVDCSYCVAPCCKLRVALTEEEAKRFASVDYPFDDGVNKALAQRDDGYCAYYVEGKGCFTYDDRPAVCLSYSCVGDIRIFNDNKYSHRKP